MKNYILIVLGMHRSGTSCLTGLLQQTGLTLGDVVEKAPYNKKGNRENLDIRSLNDAVLSYNNSTWDSPPSQISWNKEHVKKREQIIQQYSGEGVWGFKDPRTVFTLPFWLDGINSEKVQCIGTFRHPLLVAKSLNARDPNFAMEDGINLWKQYNEKVFDYYEKKAFPILNFDLNPYAYLQSFREAINLLENPLLSTDCDLNFFEDKLRNQTVLNKEETQRYKRILNQAKPTYKKLKLLSVKN